MPVEDHLVSFGRDFYSFTFFLDPWSQILAILTLFLDLIEKGFLEEVA
jgi:hypothetical protein